MEIGVYTFGDLPFGVSGAAASHQRMQEIVSAAQLADQAGLHVFGVGEHHRTDYAVSAYSVVLGAIAISTPIHKRRAQSFTPTTNGISNTTYPNMTVAMT
ncbi:MAG: LLM class flavin-dependent oxidoreductase [Actinobacteria bacterium]|uniref:Unannotated protein n=1 Tax=freshwater metagenome TaxID=449393 RepID=A0A6J5ZTX5_9ZZZZ|nr:LLM class flavin-dependent oxidoreductase [Actinomycetota bacterium]